MFGGDYARLAYLALLLLAIGGFLITEFRARPGAATRQMLAWVLIFVGVFAGIGLWQDWQSSSQQVIDGRRVEVRLGGDQHFHMTLELNGTPVRFVVDTGATDIALSQRDAQRIGIDTERLAYIGQARTANGVVRTAPVVLDSVRLGEIHDSRVSATVIESELQQSLLGMTYLRRFARVSFEGNRLILER
ncbi:MAG: TIGR02281 family clan AA aspartic protease [Paracoccus sp. (in: a-proteobacteria)]|nr:TIGR02281 family clan AA aspartic protease [Paracoccus sp. (in: a-proteobacteria)]